MDYKISSTPTPGNSMLLNSTQEGAGFDAESSEYYRLQHDYPPSELESLPHLRPYRVYELKVVRDTIVNVLSKSDCYGNPSEWWYCINMVGGAAGYLPCAYLERVPTVQPYNSLNIEFARVLSDYTPEIETSAATETDPTAMKSILDDLAVHKGDLVAVLSKINVYDRPVAWWQCRTRDGRIGFLPITHLGLLDNKFEPSQLDFCRVLWDYPAEKYSDYLPGVNIHVTKGDIVVVLSKTDPQGNPTAWWRCRTRNGGVGYLPKSYLEVIRERIRPPEQPMPESVIPPAGHCIYQQGTSLVSAPFKHVRVLGRGGAAVVDEVLVTNGLEEGMRYARKACFLGSKSRNQSIRAVKEIAEEARVIGRIQHPHIIRAIFTYEELSVSGRHQYCGVLLSPVADMDLARYLAELDDNLQLPVDERDPELFSQYLTNCGKWFGCLARGLAFIHTHRIRHRDIKPSNILIKDSDIIFTDFGLSKHFEGDATTGTYGFCGPRTEMYCAPEFISEERRGRPADVWSLGCVFLELTTLLYRQSLSDFREKRGPDGQQAYHLRPKVSLQHLFMLWQIAPITTMCKLAVVWCFLMINPSPALRPTAQMVATYIPKEAPDVYPTPCICNDLFNADGVAQPQLQQRLTDWLSVLNDHPEFDGTWETANTIIQSQHIMQGPHTCSVPFLAGS